MRAFFLLPIGLAFLGCSSADSGATTEDELNESLGSIEREITPPITVPTNPKIGAKTEDVLTALKGTGSATKKKDKDGCSVTTYKNGSQAIAQYVSCATSDVVRSLHEDGTVREEHADLNKDGKIDRYSNEDEAVVQLVDNDFDGKIDVVVELVSKLKDFSLDGYAESFPKSSFLHRVREDRDRDGKLDFERLTARGTLPKN